MSVLRRIWHLGADIDTDVLAPGHAMKHGMEVIAKHCLESVMPNFASEVRRGDVIVAGPNFGIGSSREQAAQVLVHLGIAAVIAPSYSGLYFRNAFNVGLLLLTCPQSELLRDQTSVVLDASTSSLLTSSGARLPCEPIPPFLLEMVRAGGLLPHLKKRLTSSQSSPLLLDSNHSVRAELVEALESPSTSSGRRYHDPSLKETP